MARPLTPREILDAFDRWGVPHDTVPGWKTRSNGTGWSPSGISGCMHHHTAGDSSDADQLALLLRGRPKVPPPLANFGVRDDGRIDVIAAGAANHAGKGDPRVLRAVQRESYDRFPPPTRMHHKSPGAVGGNGKLYGWETYCGVGSDKHMNPRQYRVLVLSTAAIISTLDAIDGPEVRWTGKSVIGHKEWSTNKPLDPRIDMSVDRDDVDWCLTHGPEMAHRWFETGQRPDTPTTAKEAIMHTLVQQELTAVQRSLRKAGVPTTVTVVNTLAPYGVPVGPLPG
jgi:hypothetical protein